MNDLADKIANAIWAETDLSQDGARRAAGNVLAVLRAQEPVGYFARADGDGPLYECPHADLPRTPLYAATMPPPVAHVDALIGRLRAHAEAHEYIATADGEQKQWMHDLYDAAIEIERLEAEVERLRKVALQHVPHVYEGGCPDCVTGFGSRDPNCPACQILG